MHVNKSQLNIQSQFQRYPLQTLLSSVFHSKNVIFSPNVQRTNKSCINNTCNITSHRIVSWYRGKYRNLGKSQNHFLLFPHLGNRLIIRQQCTSQVCKQETDLYVHTRKTIIFNTSSLIRVLVD